MGAIAGIAGGALGLAIFQQVVSQERGYETYGTLVQLPGEWARKLIDPAVPLIPNLADAPCAEGGNVSLFSLIADTGKPVAPSRQADYKIPTPKTVPTPEKPKYLSA